MCRDRDKDRDRVRDKNGLTEAEFLARYDAGKYPRPSVTADVAAFTHTDGRPRVMLVRRGGHPFIGTWALPGGFVEPEETVETAARFARRRGASCGRKRASKMRPSARLGPIPTRTATRARA